MASGPDSSSHANGEDFARPTAEFQKDLWGDYFLNYRAPDEVIVWAVIPNTKYSATKISVRFSIMLHYIVRLLLIFPLSSKISRAAGPVPKTARNGAAYNAMLYFLISHETQAKMENEIKELDEEVKKVLLRGAGYETPFEQLNFIDAVQRLGLAYHFEKELEVALQEIYDSYNDYKDKDKDDLYLTSLRFRLLRQNGFFVPSGIFKKFMDEGGSFKCSLADDVPGLLSLYEAAHLLVHGEGVLDEALVFTKSHLKSVASQANHPLATQASHALNQPLHRGMPRLESRHFISVYEKTTSHNKSLLRLAKLDFNLLQSQHKKELQNLTRWWKSFDFGKKLPFTRDRIAEAYFWTMGPYYEPQFALGRKIFCKVFKVMSIIDDTYDAYGTMEELVPYTAAIKRWDRKCLNELPDFMKLSYEPLMDIFEEFEHDLAKEGRSHLVHYAKEEVKDFTGAYFQEAKWLHEKYIPTYDEYMTKAATISFGYYLGTIVAFLGMGEFAADEAFEWARQHPKPTEAIGIIGRLMDDMTSHTFEQSRGHVPSAVECYMKQYGLTEEKTREEFKEKIGNAWKDVNQAMFRPYNIITRPLLTCILNLARIVDVIYKGEDGYTFPGNSMKDNITQILTDPLPI